VLNVKNAYSKKSSDKSNPAGNKEATNAQNFNFEAFIAFLDL
jgi:hypothetical protein